MRKKGVLLLLILLTGIYSAFAQNKIQIALDSLKKFYPQEKIYIIYDKSEYVAGEMIRFSAFIFSGYQFSGISTNLFLELYNKEKKLIERKQLPVFDGQSAGQLLLPDKLNEDIYYIRAYTQWMLNFPESLQYIHDIFVFNPVSPQKLQEVHLPWKVTVFPEGGPLVDGIATKLAVRLNSISPLPVDWQGYLVEKGKAEKITDIKYLDPNIGLAEFTPAAGHQYEVIIEDKNGQRQVINLPMVYSSGTHLEVNNLSDSIQYIIRFRNIPGSRSGYKLVGTMNDEIVYEANIKRADTILSRFIPVAALPNGILRITLFNTADSVIAERLCFVKPLSLSIKHIDFTNKTPDITPRSLNSFQFVSDTVENPYLVTVLDAKARNPVENDNLLSALWLSNDLSLPIEKPARYFTDADSTTIEVLDALLISETWKRFAWDDILHNKFPEIKYLPDSYISLKGTIYRNKKLVANEDVNLIFHFSDSSTQIVQATSDSIGSFILNRLFFYDSAKVFYQLNQEKKSAKNISVEFETINKSLAYHLSFPETAFTLVTRQPGEPELEMVSRSLNTLNNQQAAENKYKLLQEVKIRARISNAKDKLEKELTSPGFTGFNERVFDFVNEDQHAQGYINILEWLEGRVSGVEIRGGGGTYVPYIRGKKTQIYLDEMPVDPQFISGIAVSDIAMIKVIKGYFAGGEGAGGAGGVLIYTKKGGMRTANIEPTLNNNTIKGYDKIEEFKTPDYSDADFRLERNDTRDVLFWNPFTISESSDAKVQVKFYNNDGSAGFRIIIAGMSMDGTPVFYNNIVKPN